ncbi:MAG: NapC/NirT family cytochrome c [Limisphaerales bacterium]
MGALDGAPDPIAKKVGACYINASISMNNEPPSKPSNRLPFVRNWISLVGLIILLGSVFAFILLFVFEFFAKRQNPYVGILMFVVAPAFFVLGLFLMGLGRILYRRQEAHAAGREFKPTFLIDLSNERHRRRLGILALGGVVFLLISAVGSHETYRITSSVQFCGQACHAPMEPQYVAYQHSPHSKVECTECHIGSGTGNMLKAKLNGVHQLVSMITGDYSKPTKLSGKIAINQSTCEQCHWPQRYVGNVERSFNHYLADETNSTFSVRLLLKVGGGDPTHGPPGGIHWHMNIGSKVEYIATDAERQDIPWVRITHSNGEQTEFRRPEFKDDTSKHNMHVMDCMDCHNRPAHQFRAPNDAVDLALYLGAISTNLPNIKKEAVQALIGAAATQTEGIQKIAESMRKSYPARPEPEVKQAIAAVQDIYRLNFFPQMQADWRTHPNNIGHKDWPGCFRCHDGLHKTADGKKKLGASDCNSCHIILAQGSGEELKKLSVNGHNFFHVDAPYSDFDCNKCHTGAIPR